MNKIEKAATAVKLAKTKLASYWDDDEAESMIVEIPMKCNVCGAVEAFTAPFDEMLSLAAEYGTTVKDMVIDHTCEKCK